MDKSSEEDISKNGLEDEEDDAELYNAAETLTEQYSLISSVIGDMLEDATSGQKVQIDPNPSWFMNTMSGLEGLLLEALEEGDTITKEIITGAQIIDCDGYTCGECGKNEPLKEEMVNYLNLSHGHKIKLQDTPSVTDVKTGFEALKTKVEVNEEAIRNLNSTKQKIIEEKQTLKQVKDKK